MVLAACDPAEAPSSSSTATTSVPNEGASDSSSPDVTSAFDGTPLINLEVSDPAASVADELTAAIAEHPELAGLQIVTPAHAPDAGFVQVTISKLSSRDAYRVEVEVTSKASNSALTMITDQTLDACAPDAADFERSTTAVRGDDQACGAHLSDDPGLQTLAFWSEGGHRWSASSDVATVAELVAELDGYVVAVVNT